MQMMKSIFRGVGQVMFQGNALSGALILAGIACPATLVADAVCRFAHGACHAHRTFRVVGVVSGFVSGFRS